ncbi:MAG: PD40 domain-containing protein [Candidatus Rokubacteria bacterium]|nr:PD40 domain-containing protein [Candidatus Rokubacteria bacterium]
MRWALDRRAVLRLGLAGAAGALIERVQATRLARAAPPLVPDPRERRLATLRQLTFGGQNAEAYFDWTGAQLIFQSTRPPFGCDQIFAMRADGSEVRLVSTGKGRTTCSFFFPDGKRAIYASTHLGSPECPPRPDMSQGYVWPIYPAYEIFGVDLAGGSLQRLTDNPGYDAEGAVSPDGSRIVFTSLREGDLDLYAMDADGTNVRRLTEGKGYDGGPFFSWDGRSIVYRSARPETRQEIEEYEALLTQGLVRPRRLEIFRMRWDGTGVRQVTKNGAANFAPFMHPNGQQIIFSSNLHDPTGRTFALYLVNADGSGLERVTYAESFASFPMFSRDGARLVFCGSRNARAPREMNVFLADWVS